MISSLTQPVKHLPRSRVRSSEPVRPTPSVHSSPHRSTGTSSASSTKSSGSTHSPNRGRMLKRLQTIGKTPRQIAASVGKGRRNISAAIHCGRMRPRSLGARSAFDGAFFTGVRTTRIYCRPVCPVRPARSANVLFFGSAAASRNEQASDHAFAADPRRHRGARRGAGLQRRWRAVCVLSRKDSSMKPRSLNLPIAWALGHDTCYGCFSVIRVRLRAKSPRRDVCRLRNG
jgi:hypothetical protein